MFFPYSTDKDIALGFVAPTDPTDYRVITAEELSLQSRLGFLRDRFNGKPEWEQVSLTTTPPRTINIEAIATSPLFKRVEISASINFPALNESDTDIVVDRIEYVSAVLLPLVITAVHDPILGNFSYQYEDPAGEIAINDGLENTIRYRSAWLIVRSFEPLTKSLLLSQIKTEGDNYYLPVEDITSIGFSPTIALETISTLHFFALENFVADLDYEVVTDGIEILPICEVRRQQNCLEFGYFWGRNGEDEFVDDFTIVPVFQIYKTKNDLELEAQSRLREIIKGEPGVKSSYRRAILNSVQGAVVTNPNFPGISVVSPNGYDLRQNSQRIHFTNQKITQIYYFQAVVATDSGAGNALITSAINDDSPPGSHFSQDIRDHRVFDLAGNNITDKGRFAGLGSTDSITWSAGANAQIFPGDTLIINPGIVYSSGSGFPLPFVQVERVWRNSSELNPGNIKQGWKDDCAFLVPNNGDEFLVVTGEERAAIHYIYKMLSLTANNLGVIAAPISIGGCIAFVEGLTETIGGVTRAKRVDSPFCSGLSPNTSYRCLVYYPPKALNETWQFQVKYSPYQGLRTEDFLINSQIVSEPQFYLTTQGGGTSVYQGEGDYTYRPISMSLPQLDAHLDMGNKIYDLDAPVLLASESESSEPYTFRHCAILAPGRGLVMPKKGMFLTWQNIGSVHTKSMSGILANESSVPLGFACPTMENKQAKYQVICSFVVSQNDKLRLFVATVIAKSDEQIIFDSRTGTAMDLYYI